MIATLLFTIVAQQQQPNLYRTTVKQPTNKNGYEEYLQAADMAISSDLRDLVVYVDEPNARGTKLDRQRQVAKQMSRIQTTIERGNGKPIFYPAALDFETLLPELSYFRTVGSALVHKAEVHFADGQVNQGFKTLLATMEFGDKLSGSGPVIHNLVGRIINRPALELIAKNAALMSIPAANDTRKSMLALLNAPSPWAISMRTEMKGIIDSLPLIFEKPENLFGTTVDDEMNQRVKGLTAEAKNRVIKDLTFAISRHYESRLEMLERPEREWPKIAKQIDELAGPDDPIAKAFFEAFIPAFARIDIYEIARRTHYRLLVVYGEVAKFRWNHGYYPGSLDQIEDKSVITDPLNGQPFEYERTDTSFRLYSNGTEDTGKIDLFYVPPSPTTDRPD